MIMHLKPAGVWSNERVIIFTEYRATQDYIQSALQERFPSHVIVLINGSMNLAAKLDAISP